MKKFENKVVFITGGASGIGKASAIAIAKEGAKVVIADIEQSKHEEALNEIKEAGTGEALFIAVDVSDAGQLKQAIAKTVEIYGRLDIALNNAGISANGIAFAEDTPESFQKILQVNLNGAKVDTMFTPFHLSTVDAWHQTQAMTEESTFLYMRYEIAQMLAQGGGIIANTVSMGGLKAQPDANTPSYAVSKAALIHLTKYTALQYARDNIRINAVAPGLVATETMKKTLSPQQQAEIIKHAHPNGKVVEPVEIAEAFIYLCSDAARSVTGIVLPVDGGLSAS